MADFKLFYPILVKNEGGYADNKKDIGGETYKGIARKYHPSWSGWKAIDLYKNLWLQGGKSLETRSNWVAFSKELSKDLKLQKSIQDFYESLYWDSLNLDLIGSQSVAEMAADHGVNTGTGRVGWMLQYVLRTSFNRQDIILDGKIGLMTLKAINSVNPQSFHARLADLRRDFYRYRCGEYDAYRDAPRLMALHQFFRSKLNLKPNPSQKVFLKTWLDRVNHMTFIN